MGAGNSREVVIGALRTLQEGSVDAPTLSGVVAALLEKNIPSADVFESVSVAALRSLFRGRPRMSAVLVAQLIEKLYSASVLLRSNTSDAEVCRAMNCARLLTRMLPVLFEDRASWIFALLWDNEFPVAADGEPTPSASLPEDRVVEPHLPLGRLLVDAVMMLLFTARVTCPAPARADDPFALLWYSGLGATYAGTSSKVMVGRRIELMRLLLVLFSPPLYVPHAEADATDTRLAAHACSIDCPNTLLLWYSLLNTVAHYDPIGWGVPYGTYFVDDSPELELQLAVEVLNVLLDHGRNGTTSLAEASASYQAAGAVVAAAAAAAAAASSSSGASTPIAPAPRVVVSGTDASAPARASSSAPAAAGPYGAPLKPTPAPGAHVSSLGDDNSPSPPSQMYHYYRDRLTERRECQMVSGAFLRQLYSISVAQSASLPSSKMSVSCYQELLVLVWKLLEQNVPFRLHFVKHEDALQLIVPVLILMHEYRRDAAKLALMHHMAAMLLMLSGERDAAVQLNRPLVMRLPIDLPLVVGSSTFADLFVMVVCHVVGGGVSTAHTLHEVLLAALVNQSAYMRGIGRPASQSLIGLLERFLSARMLFHHERARKYVVDLIDVVNNLVQYHYEGSADLIYVILRERRVFDLLLHMRDTSDLKLRTSADVTASSRTSSDGFTAHSAAPVVAPPVDHADGAASRTAPADVDGAGDTDSDSDRESQSTTVVNTGAPDTVSAAAAAAAADAGASAPAVASPSTATIASVDTAPASGAVPDWFESWRHMLPLSTIHATIHALADDVTERARQEYSGVDQVVDYIRKNTLVGLLPVPHRIVVRLFRANTTTDWQVSALLWSQIYVQQLTPPLFVGTDVRMFFSTVPPNTLPAPAS